MNKILLIFLLLITTPAHATPVVADLSNYRIAMDAGFNGTRIFLFGTRNDNGDIVVVVRGEQKDYIVRKKEKFAGMWVNHDRMKFYNMPNFYALASSKPLSEINQIALFNRLGIGEENLLISPSDISKSEQFNKFKTAFIDHQRSNHIYYTNTDYIGFMGETLFKTVIEFPLEITPLKFISSAMVKWLACNQHPSAWLKVVLMLLFIITHIIHQHFMVYQQYC